MTMTEEVLGALITELGEQIKVAKTNNLPKEEWDPLLKEMLQCKVQFKQLFGKEFGIIKSSDETNKQQEAQQQQESQESSEKNRVKNEAKALAKAEKEAKKNAARDERERRERDKANKLAGIGQINFGDTSLIQSQHITNKVWTKIEQLKPTLNQKEVLIRGFLQTSRSIGKGIFVLIRSSFYSVQGVCFEGTTTNSNTNEDATISSAMIKYMAALPLESVVDVKGIITIPEHPIESATQKMVEIHITEFHCVCKVTKSLPFQMEDACRPESGNETDVGAYNEDDEIALQQDNDGIVRVGQKMRLDYRWLDLRTPANQAIFRIESMVGSLFREFLEKENFIEIHTPKIIGGASEGGSDVFTLQYFNQPACLAMSPQLHKQMVAACSGFERVYECGPVFRAEKSNTRRHLCEFTGFDLEMTIHEHYDEVLHVMSNLFIHIFDGLTERCSSELDCIRQQHPFVPLQYSKPTLKLTYGEGCQLLRTAGIEQDDYDDLSTENEKKLGDIVKEKFHTDFYFMDKYPLDVRPFYTMPCPNNPKLSNSYDFFIRGQEIVSGAQRIHDVQMLSERATAKGIDLKDIESYINSFRYGAMPHGGGGIGLERVVMLYLGLPNIRKSAWFPRDPKRLAP